ncbi:hypothetical protein WN943_003108 [Citrus x changshan-huyou]
MVPALDQKPRRGKGPRGPLIDGRRIGLPEGWMFEQRQRTHANYKGKIDQFYYEPGTNKQFRSFKEVEKHLLSKGQNINPITPNALQENDRQKLETPPVVGLTNDAAGSSNPDPQSSSQQPKRGRKIGAKAKGIKFDFKNRPEEVTWVLADARTDNWSAFIGQEKHLPSRVATDGVQDAKTKAEETNTLIPPNELQIIDAVPLRMVPALDQKPRRGKGPRGPLIDGRRIGLPEGWMFEQRQRTHANYKGKIDQFYYEPGTNKQFRSFKEVEKHLLSKGQNINPITPNALQENDRQKLETPPVVGLTNDAAGSSNPDPQSSSQQPKRGRKIGAKAKGIKFDFKNRPEEVTWVLADARTDNWSAFIGQEKPLPSRVATDRVQDAETKAEETNILIPPNELQIIDAVPLRMVPPLDQKPRRGKGPRSPLIDGGRIGLPEGWMLEQRQRTHANYKGKIDQFYYKPGTMKQFRSFKEVKKHLQSKGKNINPITHNALQENDQKKLETPPVVVLTNPKRRRKIGAKAKCTKFDFKNQPQEVIWVLAYADTDNWIAFIGQEKVSNDTQQTWSKTFMEINNPWNQDHNNK